MSSTDNSRKEQTTVDEEVARVRNTLRMGRLALDFDGMDTMTVLQRSEYVRHSLHQDKSRLPENANRPISDISAECDREEYFPAVHLMCEKMIASSEKRFEKAENALSSMQISTNIRPGKKAAGVRRTIDAQFEAGVASKLSFARGW